MINRNSKLRNSGGSITKNQKIKDKSISKSKTGDGRLKNDKVLSVGGALGGETDIVDQGEASFLPLAPPFSHRECNAHTWSIPVMMKYLSEEMELGRSFIYFS
jgi:hypothetical protein